MRARRRRKKSRARNERNLVIERLNWKNWLNNFSSYSSPSGRRLSVITVNVDKVRAARNILLLIYVYKSIINRVVGEVFAFEKLSIFRKLAVKMGAPFIIARTSGQTGVGIHYRRSFMALPSNLRVRILIPPLCNVQECRQFSDFDRYRLPSNAATANH